MKLAEAMESLERIKHRQYDDEKAGRRILVRALKVVTSQKSKHRSGPRSYRDAHVIAGIYFARHHQEEEARQAYEEALVGEWDSARRSLVKLNLGRLALAQGDLQSAAHLTARIPTTAAPNSVRAGLLLLRARVHLTLGFNGSGEQILRDMKERKLAEFPLKLEHRYLGLVARLRQPFHQDKFESRLSDFFDWIHNTAPSERIAAFYELEIWLLHLATGSRRIRNRRSSLDRVNFLAKKCNAVVFQKAYKALDNWHNRRAVRERTDTDRRRFTETLDHLAAANSHLTYQMVVTLLARRIARKDPSTAGWLLRNLKLHWDRLEVGFSSSQLRKLQGPGNTQRQFVESLWRSLPTPVIREWELPGW